jgi:hypothetical protein
MFLIGGGAMGLYAGFQATEAEEGTVAPGRSGTCGEWGPLLEPVCEGSEEFWIVCAEVAQEAASQLWSGAHLLDEAEACARGCSGNALSNRTAPLRGVKPACTCSNNAQGVFALILVSLNEMMSLPCPPYINTEQGAMRCRGPSSR